MSHRELQRLIKFQGGMRNDCLKKTVAPCIQKVSALSYKKPATVTQGGLVEKMWELIGTLPLLRAAVVVFFKP